MRKKKEQQSIEEESPKSVEGNLALKSDIIELEDKDTKNRVKNKVRTFLIRNKSSIEYTYLKIVPDITILDSQKTYLIAKSLYGLLTMNINTIFQQKDGVPFKTNSAIKISYIINMTSEGVDFYFNVPKIIAKILKEKIYEVFSNCNIKEDMRFEISPPSLTPKKDINDVECNTLELKYNDTFALNTDSTLYSLNELMSNSQWLEENDRIVIVFNFTRIGDREFEPFKCQCLRQISEGADKYNQLNRKISADYISSKFFELSTTLTETITNTLTGALGGFGDLDLRSSFNDSINERLNRTKMDALELVGMFTREKITGQKLSNEILIVSKSNNIKRRFYNLKCVTDSFAPLTFENELIAKKAKLPTNLCDVHFGLRRNIMSLSEISKFLTLPSKNLLQDYQNIEQIKVKQTKTVDFVKNGIFYLGVNDYKNILDDIYLPKDYDSESLSYVLIAPQGGGKTTTMTNLTVNAYKAGQGNVIIDYIKNCEYSQNVIKNIDTKNIIIIDAQDLSTLPIIDFNEYDIAGIKDPKKIGIIISNKIDATKSIINTLNEDKPLTANMSELFTHACQIVYSFPNMNLGNIVDFLLDHEYRMKIIAETEKLDFHDVLLNKKLKEALTKIDIINEYGNDTDDSGKKVKVVTGTATTKINGIMARIMQLKDSFLLYNMMYAGKTMNFVELLDKGKTIVVKLPEHCVSPEEKNVIATFITMKTILATKKRGGTKEQPHRTNIWVDEIYQVPTVEDVVMKSLSQLRKYGLKVIISCHRMSQLNNKRFSDELLGGGGSFSFLAGCKEIQLKEFADQLDNFEDIYNLKPFHAYHIIHSNKQGDWKGVTTLPPPIKK